MPRVAPEDELPWAAPRRGRSKRRDSEPSVGPPRTDSSGEPLPVLLAHGIAEPQIVRTVGGGAILLSPADAQMAEQIPLGQEVSQLLSRSQQVSALAAQLEKLEKELKKTRRVAKSAEALAANNGTWASGMIGAGVGLCCLLGGQAYSSVAAQGRLR